MMPARTSAILADDHPLVLRGLVDLLSTEDDFEVIAIASDGKAALSQILEKRPDIAVLDLVMPKLNGLDILRELVQLNSHVRVIFLSAFITDEESLQAIAIGAWGILLKESAPETLIECMRTVRGGDKWITTHLFDARPVQKAEPGLVNSNDPLTGREREVVNLVAEGLSNKHIARLLNVSEGTVKVHLHNVFAKLEIANRTALTAMVVSNRKAT